MSPFSNPPASASTTPETRQSFWGCDQICIICSQNPAHSSESAGFCCISPGRQHGRTNVSAPSALLHSRNYYRAGLSGQTFIENEPPGTVDRGRKTLHYTSPHR